MRDLPSVLPKYMKALLKSLAFIILYISIYFAAQVAVTVIYSAMIITHMIITGQSIDWTSVYDVILVNTTTAVLISILLTLPIYHYCEQIIFQSALHLHKHTFYRCVHLLFIQVTDENYNIMHLICK